jgi:plastocyanin
MHARRPIALVVVLVALCGAVFFAADRGRAQEQVTIDVGDFWYCASSFEEGTCETAIDAGDTVVWDLSSGINSHTVTHCGASCDDPTSSPLFDSGTVAAGGTYSYTFNAAGTFLYYCEVHPTLMFGRIVVQASAQLSPSPDDGGPTATPHIGRGGLAPTGGGPGESPAPWWPATLALAFAGALLALIGATHLRSANRRTE